MTVVTTKLCLDQLSVDQSTNPTSIMQRDSQTRMQAKPKPLGTLQWLYHVIAAFISSPHSYMQLVNALSSTVFLVAALVTWASTQDPQAGPTDVFTQFQMMPCAKQVVEHNESSKWMQRELGAVSGMIATTLFSIAFATIARGNSFTHVYAMTCLAIMVESIVFYALLHSGLTQMYCVARSSGEVRVEVPLRYVWWAVTTVQTETALFDLIAMRMISMRERTASLLTAFFGIACGFGSAMVQANSAQFVILMVAACLLTAWTIFVRYRICVGVSSWTYHRTVLRRSVLFAVPAATFICMLLLPGAWVASYYGVLSTDTGFLCLTICELFGKFVIVNLLAWADMPEFLDELRMQLLEAETLRIGLQAKASATRSIMRYLFHEIRVPLNSIVLGIDDTREVAADLLYAMETTSTEQPALLVAASAAVQPVLLDITSILTVCHTSALGMGRLLDNFLSMDKLEQGQIKVENGTVNVMRMADETLRLFQPALDSKKLRLKRIGLNAPAEVIGDDHKLRQCLSNFISNAIKFSPEGGSITVALSIVYAPVPDSIKTITDEGRTTLTNSYDAYARSASMVGGNGTLGGQGFASTSGSLTSVRTPPGVVSGHDQDAAVEVIKLGHLGHNSSRPDALHTAVRGQDGSEPKGLFERLHISLQSAGAFVSSLATGSAGQSNSAMGRWTSSRSAGVLRPGQVYDSTAPTSHAGGILQHGPRLPADPQSLSSIPGPGLVRYFRVSVQDTGVGICGEDQARLFQPFQQIRAGALQKGNGTGLGLSIVRQIIQLSGGFVGVESAEGLGSTFYFCIPAEEDALQRPVSAAPEASGLVGAPAHASASTGTVLRVDTEAAAEEGVVSSVHTVGQLSPQRRYAAVGGFRSTNDAIIQADVDIANGDLTGSGFGSNYSDQHPRYDMSNAGDAVGRLVGENGASNGRAGRRSRGISHSVGVPALAAQAPDHTDSSNITSAWQLPSRGDPRASNVSALDTGPLDMSVPGCVPISPMHALGPSGASTLGEPTATLAIVESAATAGLSTVPWLQPSMISTRIGPRALASVPDPSNNAGVPKQLLRAVVVDDVAGNRLLLIRALKRRGVEECHEAADGSEALVLAERLAIQGKLASIQCWFLDESMPTMNGSAAIAILRAKYGVTSIILSVTGNAIQEDQALILQAGADAVLAKPVDLSLLEALLVKHRLVLATQRRNV